MDSSNHRLHASPLRFAIWAILFAITAPAATFGQDVYRIGPMDKLNIKVVESLATQDGFREWPALNGQYVVGPQSSLLLPYAGEITVTGKSTADIAAEIAVNIQLKFGLSSLPEAAVEIAEYRGVFVVGDITSPGQYPFSPELTPIKALALAGGISRGSESPEKVMQDFLGVSGEFSVLNAQRDFLLIKQARVDAELRDMDEVLAPVDVRTGEYSSGLIDSQQKLLVTRQETMNSQLNSLSEIKSLYTSEVSSLEQKSATQSRQIQLVTRELEKASKLADQGLVLSARVLGLESTIADLQGNLIDLGTATLRAKQEINKADREANDLHNVRRAELVLESQETQSLIRETELKIASARERMGALALSSPSVVGSANSDLQDTLGYTITRIVDGAPSQIEASAHSPLYPGDLLNVRLRRLDFAAPTMTSQAGLNSPTAKR